MDAEVAVADAPAQDEPATAAEEVESGTPPEDGAENTDGAEAESETPSDEPADDEPEDWKNLKKKYPHADEKTLRAIVSENYWKQTKELARLSKIEKEYEELRKPKAAPAEEPEEEVPPQELQALDQRIQRLDNRAKELNQATSQKLLDLTKLKESIFELKGQIKMAIDAEKDRLEDRLEVAEAKYDSTYDAWQAKRTSLDDTIDALERAREERRWTEKLHREGEARRKKEQAAVEATLSTIPAQIDSFIDSSFSALKFPLDPQLREDCAEVAREYITNYWGRHESELLADIDSEDLIRKRIEKYMGAHKISKREAFVKESAARVALTAKPTVGQGKPGSAAPQKGLSQMEIARRNLISWGERRSAR